MAKNTFNLVPGELNLADLKRVYAGEVTLCMDPNAIAAMKPSV